MGEELELSRVDTEILRYADSESPEWISDHLGVITPARVAARTQELLKTKNWLTLAQKEDLLLNRLSTILAKLEKLDPTVDLEAARVQLAYIREIGNRYDKRRAQVQVDLESYDASVARSMVAAYDIALGYMKGALRSEIDEELWDQVAQEALAHAGREVAKKAIES